MNCCVIGIGTFGYHLAVTLTQNGMNVLAVDSDMTAIRTVQDKVAHALCTHVIDEDSLRAIGIESVRIAVVCMGGNFEEAALLTALLKQKFKIPMVVCRATSTMHQEILKLVGADYVILPEQEAGIRLADKLSIKHGNFTRITPDYSLAHIHLDKKWTGKTIKDIDFEKKYNVTLIGKRQGEHIIRLDTAYTIHPDDLLVIGGSNTDLEKLTS